MRGPGDGTGTSGLRQEPGKEPGDPAPGDTVPRPPALRDNRIQLERSTPNELTISITDVVLADEGEYTCSIFTMPVRTAKALVTVLGTRWCPPASAPCLGHQMGGWSSLPPHVPTR